jgi:thiol:disulfide interchange protein
MTLLLAILQTEGTGTLSATLSGNPVMALGVLFGAGVLTSLNPCVYPMIPITASILSGTARSGDGRGRTVGLTLTYASDLPPSMRCWGSLPDSPVLCLER